MAQLVIEYISKKQGVKFNTLVDQDFSQISWLNEREPVKNMKGEKVSKSYYYQNKKEAIRITYHKIFETYEDIENVFVGIKKQIHWIGWDGEIGKTKHLQPYYFNLEPVTLGDGTETIVSYSSPKMRSFLKDERYSADDYLQSKNPTLYNLLYSNYTTEYELYLKTGDKTTLVNSMENEADASVNAVFNSLVYNSEITIKQLIISTLQ